MFGPLPQQKNVWPNFVLGGPIWACNTAIPPRIEPWTKVKLITLLRTKQFGPWTVLNFFMEWGGREAGLLTHPNRKLWCQSIHSRWFADWTFKFGSPHFPSSCVYWSQNSNISAKCWSTTTTSQLNLLHKCALMQWFYQARGLWWINILQRYSRFFISLQCQFTYLPQDYKKLLVT